MDKLICRWCKRVIPANIVGVAIYDPTITMEERHESGPLYWMHNDCVYEAVMEAVELVPEPGRR